MPRSPLTVVLAIVLSSTVAVAQAPGTARPTPTRTVLASHSLPSVVDAPLTFRLLRVSLAAGHTTEIAGEYGFVYLLSGTVTVSGRGGAATLRDGEAEFVGGPPATLRAGAPGPAVFLHFLLLRKSGPAPPAPTAPAAAATLYTDGPAISGLREGPHEFTLTRVTFPPKLPLNAPHRRSGAALYYVAGGAGTIAFAGRTEPRPAGSVQYEPSDFVHQWGNPGDTPLVLIQANISPEGAPVVILTP
jgi:quercetin dioxygenase-like cupin family protein